ncbi:MAG TPA: metallophosphoesterase family protein, partial [Acidimicrobiales bacterium]|nr:metallophosphoesterase family protein [Acidimicrobiales bacterium]
GRAAGVRVAVLADTHLRSAPIAGRRPARTLPAGAWERLRAADHILHAGDVLDAGVLDELRAVAPLHAVLGNNDVGLERLLPPTLVVELAGVRIAMIHDSGPGRGRAARLHRRFPDAAVVVFGHSHIPVDEEGDAGQRLFNPGSPTQKRAQPVATMGELELAGGAVVAHRIVPLAEPSG